MNPRRSFLYGFALGIMLATISSYYHFCRPLQEQSLSDLILQSGLPTPASVVAH
jgi:hypothetical protein